jgi:hypothetical protein
VNGTFVPPAPAPPLAVVVAAVVVATAVPPVPVAVLVVVVAAELPPVPVAVVVVVGVVVVVVVGVVVVVVVGVVVVVVVVGVVVVVVVVVVGVVVVVVVVGVVVDDVVVVVAAAQTPERLNHGSPCPASVGPPVTVAKASRSVAPAGALITAPLPVWMKEVVVMVNGDTSKIAVRLVKPLPSEVGRTKWKPPGRMPCTKQSLTTVFGAVMTVTPSKPAPSRRQAKLGGTGRQSYATIAGPAASGADGVAEAVLTARTPHMPTLAPSTAKLAPRLRSTRHSRAGRKICLNSGHSSSLLASANPSPPASPNRSDRFRI